MKTFSGQNYRWADNFRKNCKLSGFLSEIIFDAGIGFSDSELVYSSCFKPLESKKHLIARSLNRSKIHLELLLTCLRGPSLSTWREPGNINETDQSGARWRTSVVGLARRPEHSIICDKSNQRFFILLMSLMGLLAYIAQLAYSWRTNVGTSVARLTINKLLS